MVLYYSQSLSNRPQFLITKSDRFWSSLVHEGYYWLIHLYLVSNWWNCFILQDIYKWGWILWLCLDSTSFRANKILHWWNIFLAKNSSEIHKINFALNIIYAFVVIFVFRRVNSCAIFYRSIFFFILQTSHSTFQRPYYIDFIIFD